jgi:hypothetical protein
LRVVESSGERVQIGNFEERFAARLQLDPLRERADEMPDV